MARTASGRLRNEKIVIAADFAVPGIEAGAAKAFLVEPERLDHRAHGAVEHQDALGGETPQRCLGRAGQRCRFRRMTGHWLGALPLPVGERVG